jgi:hypothetical protein
MKILRFFGRVGCMILIGIIYILMFINAITLKLVTGRALCEYEPFGIDLFMLPFYWLEKMGYWNRKQYKDE